PGPNHVYAIAEADATVHDLGPSPKNLASVIAPGERVLGLAYDYNTDHLFLRIAPQQVIRVVERPSGKILREMPLPAELRTENSADLAIRSRDRHLFAVHPDGRAIAELTLFGEFVRRLELPNTLGGIDGLAFDQQRGRLLVLAGNAAHAFDLDGRELAVVALQSPVHAVSLGYDSDAQHFFVPLVDGREVGEFDNHGTLVAALPAGANGPITALDAGPRSFVRVF
ncbi:MAG: hypothetical protein JWQ62_1690, partial [Lacunisphaera sp.]|nr:hypothetical protein [Lacunisphaera sp.]